MVRAPAVYIMTNKRNGTLYTGVTADLSRRSWEHREGILPGFTKKYELKLLVWYEHHDLMTDAIAREKQIKAWKRIWKIELIEKRNPTWRDLYEDLNQ
jgi:putative endonuclease